MVTNIQTDEKHSKTTNKLSLVKKRRNVQFVTQIEKKKSIFLNYCFQLFSKYVTMCMSRFVVASLQTGSL